MRIESLSIKAATVMIFIMLAAVAVILSMAASNYFKQSALNAQLESLTRVKEIAAKEVIRKIKRISFETGMKLSHSRELVNAIQKNRLEELVELLNDPLINGFSGYADINLVSLRVFNLDYQLIGQSSEGLELKEKSLNTFILNHVRRLPVLERLKAVDALWMSTNGALLSTLVPIGGLRPVGYLEILINPESNLSGIAEITGSAVDVYGFDPQGQLSDELSYREGFLPIEYIIKTTDNKPAYRIVSYENISNMNREMGETQLITISGFLTLTLLAMVVALWLFKKFLFSPVSLMIENIGQIQSGKLDLKVSNKGLKEFSILANAFNQMTEQVKLRTSDLQQLLDIDESALICFDHNSEGVYLNHSATKLFGYTSDEVVDLEIADLFTSDISLLINSALMGESENRPTIVECRDKDGQLFNGRVVFKAVSVMNHRGIAVVVHGNIDDESKTEIHDQERFKIFEKTINNLISLAQINDALPLSDNNHQQPSLRECAVTVMNLALGCWTKYLHKSKIDLAEESKIWPVYMDKSTPTTRTLDKYLNIDKCPKNPRHQRVIDTAQFVLNKSEHSGETECQELKKALEIYSSQLSGVKT